MSSALLPPIRERNTETKFELFCARFGQKGFHSRIERNRERGRAMLVARVDGRAMLDQVIDHRELTEPRRLMERSKSGKIGAKSSSAIATSPRDAA
jgi:hypothetical protein